MSRCSLSRRLRGRSLRSRPRRQRRRPRRAAHAPFPVTVTAGNGKVTIRKRPARIVSLSPTATESLFAIGAGSQVVAVDDQSDYPKSAPKTTLSGLHAERRGDRRATGPTSSWSSYDPKGLVDALDAARDPGARPQRGADAPRRVPADPPARHGHRARAQARRRSSPRMKAQIATIVASTRAKADGLTVYHELDAGPLLGRPRTRSSGASTRCSACGTSPTRPTRRARATRSSRPSTSSASSPDLIVLADIGLLRAEARRPSPRGRAGARIAAVKTGSIVRIDDSIASRWGPRLVDFFRAVGERDQPRCARERTAVEAAAAHARRAVRSARARARLGGRGGRLPRRLARRRRRSSARSTSGSATIAPLDRRAAPRPGRHVAR